jgi:hypothetical protein
MEVVLRSQEDGRRVLLHLINFTGEMTRPIQRIVPLEQVRVSLQVDRDFTRVRTLLKPGEWAVRRDADRRIQFVLPRIEEYEVVVIE